MLYATLTISENASLTSDFTNGAKTLPYNECVELLMRISKACAQYDLEDVSVTLEVGGTTIYYVSYDDNGTAALQLVTRNEYERIEVATVEALTERMRKCLVGG